MSCITGRKIKKGLVLEKPLSPWLFVLCQLIKMLSFRNPSSASESHSTLVEYWKEKLGPSPTRYRLSLERWGSLIKWQPVENCQFACNIETPMQSSFPSCDCLSARTHWMVPQTAAAFQIGPGFVHWCLNMLPPGKEGVEERTDFKELLKLKPKSSAVCTAKTASVGHAYSSRSL